jgi:hypothetical protein
METDPVSEKSCFHFSRIPVDGRNPIILYILVCFKIKFFTTSTLLLKVKTIEQTVCDEIMAAQRPYKILNELFHKYDLNQVPSHIFAG